MQVDVNYFVVLLAALSSIVVSSIWFAPKVFGNTWKSLVNIDEKRKNSGSLRALAISFASSLITAYILAHFTFLAHKYFGSNNYMQVALTTALWLWLGMTAVRFIVQDTLEGRPTKLTLLKVSNEFVTIIVMGVIIGLFVPAIVPA